MTAFSSLLLAELLDLPRGAAEVDAAVTATQSLPIKDLTRDAFDLFGQRMGEKIVLVLAFQDLVLILHQHYQHPLHHTFFYTLHVNYAFVVQH